MPLVPTPVNLAALTTGIDGTGVFDKLMKVAREHLDVEFQKNRIRGPEYSTVYLGSLEAILQSSVTFLLQRDKASLEAELLVQQVANAVLEGKVLEAQECKLKAEYDVLLATKLKTDQETLLLQWKVATEKAQTIALGVDENSVVGKQKSLYAAQTAGFTRDAEQKAAKIMVDSWNTRRMTDEGTVADGTNMLHDPSVGRAVTKLLSGVAA